MREGISIPIIFASKRKIEKYTKSGIRLKQLEKMKIGRINRISIFSLLKIAADRNVGFSKQDLQIFCHWSKEDLEFLENHCSHELIPANIVFNRYCKSVNTFPHEISLLTPTQLGRILDLSYNCIHLHEGRELPKKIGSTWSSYEIWTWLSNSHLIKWDY